VSDGGGVMWPITAAITGVAVAAATNARNRVLIIDPLGLFLLDDHPAVF
jgi:hypothetical protein